MKFRVARHTEDLDAIICFYTGIIGLTVLGGFRRHNDYDGVFLGLPDAGWHLEFTTSSNLPCHQPDHDDLLVFYARSATEYEAIKQACAANNIGFLQNRNPYWNLNGFSIADPDGFIVVVAVGWQQVRPL